MNKLTSPALSLLVAVALLAGCDDGDTHANTCDPAVTQCGLSPTPDGTDVAKGTDEGASADALALDAGPSRDAPAPDVAVTDVPTFSPAEWVVDGAWLEAHLDDAAYQVVDVREEGSYNANRIPGALHVSVLDVRETVDGIAGQVAAPETVAAVLSDAGVVLGATVIVVGDDTGTLPSRLAWTLAYYGHDARVLDGGYDAWVLRGQLAEGGFPVTTASTYATPTAVEPLRVDGAWVLAHHSDAQVHLVDARSAGEYAAGHIPGALSVDWTTNVVGGVLRPRAEVEALYASVPTDEIVVAYCASGTRASVTWIVLSWLGYEDVRLYDGSWAEWSTLAGAPVETN